MSRLALVNLMVTVEVEVQEYDDDHIQAAALAELKRFGPDAVVLVEWSLIS